MIGFGFGLCPRKVNFLGTKAKDRIAFTFGKFYN